VTETSYNRYVISGESNNVISKVIEVDS